MDWNQIKYDQQARHGLQRLLDARAALDLSPSYRAALTLRRILILYMLRLPGLPGKSIRQVGRFSAILKTSTIPPLHGPSVNTWRAFAIWCVSTRKLQPTSTQSYILAVKFVHHLKGLPCIETATDPVLLLILRGAANITFANPPKSQTRRVVTLPMLLTIGHRIASTS